jgi:monoamine oxidase
MPYELEPELELELELELEGEYGAPRPHHAHHGEGEGWQPLSFPEACRKILRSTRVAVVGGGLGGLMAARRLGQQGVKVTLFEARRQVGGRVLSNTRFSNGRITEEGAELIGSFHTRWLALARHYGLAMISRMKGGLYHREGLDVKLTLDKPLTMAEIISLEKEMETRVLEPIAQLAKQINDPSRPWNQQQALTDFDIPVADALVKHCKIDKKADARLWKNVEFLLVNNEVAPLEEMNFLGLLCKVKAGQGKRFTGDGDLMGYWSELEIFRCADGCQRLATEIAKEIQTKYGAEVRLNTAVTDIALSKRGVRLGSKRVINPDKGTLAPGRPAGFESEYVVLAIPPSVWAGVTITDEGRPANPKDEIGEMNMGPAVKFFSDVKERFWIKEKSAPYGGSSTLGQVWEGTDNQTRAGNQGIVLSVFAGPTITDPSGRSRVPREDEFGKGLRKLYSGYSSNLIKPLFSNWPKVPFIMTGYASPKKNQIFTIGKKLNEPFHGRLFFAGDHTHMGYFGYMEGALRSGELAADKLMRQRCGGLTEPVG